MLSREESEKLDFHKGSSEKIYIFLQMMQEYLFYTLYDAKRKKFLHTGEINFTRPFTRIADDELKALFFSLGDNTEKKVFCHPGSRFSLVPQEFMQKDISGEVMQLNFKLAEDESIKRLHINELDSWLLFTEEREYKKLASLVNPEISVNASACFLKSLLLRTFYPQSNDLFADFSEKHLKIAVFRNKKLMLYNSYPYRSDEDALYHILNISKHFEFGTEKDNYHFSGLIEKDSSLYKLIYSYIRYPFFTRKPDNFSYHSQLDDFSLHRYFNLFSIAVCVS